MLRSQRRSSPAKKVYRAVLRVFAAFTLMMTYLLLVDVQSASASCGETTKFVEEHLPNPGTGVVSYFGTRGTFISYDYSPICSGGGVANSFFMRLSADYTNFVETGTQQTSSQPSSRAHAWGEWRYYPASVVVQYYDSAFTVTTGDTYQTDLQNSTGNSWNFYIKRPSEPSYTYLGNTGNLAAYAGIPESEFSRYGGVPPNNLMTALQERDTYTGSWTSWQSMICDYSQDSITTSKVYKVDNQDWFLTDPAQANTGC